jgi:large subunit ribosomal protein L24
MRKIKSKDDVIVIAGRDKGRRGEVLSVRADGRLVVAGINIAKKHQRGDPNQGKPGGIVDKEAPIQASNVAIYNDETGKADRVGFRIEDGRKVRYFKSTNKLVDA